MELMSEKRHITTGLPLMRYDETTAMLFAEICEAICFADDIHDIYKTLRTTPFFEQINKEFDFERPNKDLYVYQKKRDTGERWGKKGDYLMKISFDEE